MSKRRFISAGPALGLFAAGILSAATSAAPVDEQKVEQILRSVSPSVVKVEARNGIRKVATGVVIDKEGTIVTTALISPRDEKITVLTFEGKQFTADFKGFDMVTGLAVIQVKDKSLPAIALAKAGDARPGAWAGSIGFSPENTPAITQGIVSSVTEERMRLNLWVMPGSSGTPIVNSDGRMTGVLRGSYIDEQPIVIEFRDQQYAGRGTVISRAEAPSSGMALAVPVDLVLSIAGDIRKNGKVLRGWIGFTVVEADGRLEVEQIEPKSPAELAKIKVGDIIVRLDGRDLTSGAVFTQEIRKRKPGMELTLGLKRDGADKEVKVKLGEYTEADSRRELETRFPDLFVPIPSPTKPSARTQNLEQFFGWENRKYIGVTLQELTKDLADFFGAKDGKGLLVVQFAEDSPGRKAGLKVGDVLLKADGRTLESITDLTDLIGSKKKDEKIRLDILRDKKPMSLEVPVGEDTSRPPNLDDESYRSLQEYQKSLGSRPGLQNVQETFKKMTEEAKKNGAKNLFRVVAKGGIYYQV